MSSSHLDFCVLLLQACCLFAPVASHHFPVVTRAVQWRERDSAVDLSVDLDQTWDPDRSCSSNGLFHSRNREIASLHMNLTKAQRLRTTSAGFCSAAFLPFCSRGRLPSSSQRAARGCARASCESTCPGAGGLTLRRGDLLHRSYRAREQRDFTPVGAGARCIAPHFRLPGGRRAVQQNLVCCLRMRPASDNSSVCRAWSPSCVAWRLCTLAPDFPGADPCSPGGGQKMCPSSVSHGASSSYLPPGRASGVYGDWGHSC